MEKLKAKFEPKTPRSVKGGRSMNKTLKLKQTKANKQKFWSPLLDLLKITTPVTKVNCKTL